VESIYKILILFIYWIVTNERRTKLEILTNEKLVKILDFIKSNPGIHARDEKIESVLKITRTPFLKHVMTLEHFKLIRSKKIGKSLHYFLSDVAPEYDKLKIVFLNQLTLKIIEELFKDESTTISSMGETLDIYSGTILYHLKKLKELNIVKPARNQAGNKIHLVNIELLKIYNEFFKEPDFSLLLRAYKLYILLNLLENSISIFSYRLIKRNFGFMLLDLSSFFFSPLY